MSSAQAPTISVVVPTIAGRETYLEACLEAYRGLTATRPEIIVVRDKATCGMAWVEGAAKARGDYIHFSADDLVPHAGWDVAAIEVCDRGFLPAPRILNTDGSLQSCGGEEAWEREKPTGARAGFSRIPFLSRSQWERVEVLVRPVLGALHYFSDNAISHAARKAGFDVGVHRHYSFVHHLADVGRGAGTTWHNRMQEDHIRFSQWVRSL
jgi:hypothetical protein